MCNAKSTTSDITRRRQHKRSPSAAERAAGHFLLASWFSRCAWQRSADHARIDQRPPLGATVYRYMVLPWLAWPREKLQRRPRLPASWVLVVRSFTSDSGSSLLLIEHINSINAPRLCTAPRTTPAVLRKACCLCPLAIQGKGNFSCWLLHCCHAAMLCC